MFGFAAAIPDRQARLPSELPSGLSPAILPAAQFKLDSKSTRKNLAAQTNTGWSIVSSPNAISAQENSTEAITCLSASDCWAVGSSYAGAQIEHWDGTSWSIVSSAGARGGLNGVTCVSASDCWAVGNYYFGSAFHTLIEHWNGTSWSIISSPNTSTTDSNSLIGVTCALASDCWAVGFYDTNPNTQPVRHTLIERWNGISWSIVASPNDTNGRGQLYGVTCASASDCWAVGTLIEHWDGSSWAIFTAPSNANTLHGVTCNSAFDCWAVGDRITATNDQTLVEHWNGSAWSITASPNAGTYADRLKSVTCASATDCWAVGYYYYQGTVTQTLIEHWDGNAWAVTTSANTNGQNNNELNGVACPSSNCWAVGHHHAAIASQTLTEQWNGTSWVIVSSPNTGGTTANEILGLTCTSALDCTAVGYYPDAYNKALIERWNGNSWMIASAPNILPGATLSGVACTSASECWAVGYTPEYFQGIRYYRDPVSVRWDGSSWAFYWLYGGGGETFLNSATCASASDCWAVGYVGVDHPKSTFITHQNGAGWATVTSPNVPGADNSVLRSVTCVSSSDCWAVGNDRTDTNVHTLIEHWNGSSWAILTSPNISSINLLTSVACTSASDCWAVGFATMGNGAVQTLIEHWNGSAWLVVTSPNTDITRTNELKGVSCVSASDCWAVGDYVNNAGVAQTLTEHWNGSAWNVIDSPNASSTRDNKFNAVSCASSANCWAAGSYINESGIAQTLIERWTAPLQVLSAVSRKTHGAAGTFDINLPVTGTPGVECRTGGDSGSYQVIATLGPAVTMNEASVLAGTGSVDSTAVNGSQVTVNLSGVTNGQTIVIRIEGVNDGTASNIDIPMGVLFGDVTGNGVVNSSDISTTKKLSGQAAGPLAFRTDVNANGVTNSSDLAAVKAASGTTLP